MNEVFKTGAVFDLVDNFSPELARVIGGLEKFDEAVQASQAELKKFGFGNLAARTDKQLDALVQATGLTVDKMIAHFDRVDKAVDGTMGVVGKLGSAMSGDLDAAAKLGADGVIGNLANVDKAITGSMGEVAKLAGVLSGDLTTAAATATTDLVAGFGRADESIATAVVSATALKTEIGLAAAAANGIHIPMLPGAGAGPGAGGGGAGPGAGMGPRAPRGNHSGGGGGHGGFHFRAPGMHLPGGGHVGISEGSSGMAPAIGAFAAGETMVKAIEHAFDFEHWVSILKANGMSDDRIGAAKQAAWANAGANPNASATESLKTIIELNKVTGNLEESMKLLPTFSVAESGMQSVKAEGLHSQFNAGTQVFNFAKALEEMNATQNPEDKTAEEREARVKLYSRELLRTMITSNGTFDGNAAFAMTNNSGGASQNWDMNMATIVAPLLGDIMKHSKLGNADYMALKSYAGGGITSKATAALVKYGLADADKDTYTDKTGIHLNANSSFAEGITENIWEWSKKKLAAIQDHGTDINDQKQMNEIINEIGSNKSTTMLMRAVLEPGTRAQMQKEINQRGLVPEDAAGILTQNDPVLKLDALHKKWDDFLTALGGPMTDTAIKTLTSIAGGLNSLAQTMEAHPDATKNIGVALGAIAVGLGALAVVAFTAFVPGGFAVLGIATLASALTGLAAVNWNELRDNFSKNVAFIKGAFDQIDAALTSFFTGLVDALRKIPGLGRLIPGRAEAPVLPGQPTQNPSGAPLTPAQTAWQLQHPGQPLPDDPTSPVLRDMRPRGTEALGPSLPLQHPSSPAPAAPSGIDPSTPGFVPISLVTGVNDNVKKTTDGFRNLNERTGLINASFGGLKGGSDDVKAKFTDLGTGSTGLKNALDILSQTAIGAARALAEVALSGGTGGGSGIINASWGGGGSGGSWGGNALAVGSGFGGGSWAQSGATKPEVAAYIRHAFGGQGIDPETALRVSQSEGFNQYTGDYGTSFGPFQLHYGGSGIRGMNSDGLGDRFTRETGLNARDPKTWKAQIDYAAKIARQEGWGAWHGAQHVGIGNRQGIGTYHGPAPTVDGRVSGKTSTPGTPAKGGGHEITAQNMPPVHVHLTHVLDGRVLARSVTKHQSVAMRFPNSVGGPNSSTGYVSPGTPVTDAA